MSSQNIVVFGDPAIDTRFIAELAGVSYISPFDPFRSVFETKFYHVTIDDQPYTLFHTAGFPSSRMGRSSLQAPNVLEKLYYFIPLVGSINLLIYVVCADKPTSSNFRFFYDYVCQQDVPIILVQTTHTFLELSWFNLVLTLDGADAESDKVNLHKAITKHLNRNLKLMLPINRFESAARGCWRLLGKEASWSFADFRDALKLDYKKNGWLTKNGVDAMRKRIIERVQMSLKKQSAIEQVSVGDDVQQRVDAILSNIIMVGNVTPISFLSVATENIENISETVLVCATTIDLRS
jgi:hypothetical protein